MTSGISQKDIISHITNDARSLGRHVILLVEDHEIVRHGISGIIRLLLKDQGEVEILETSTFFAANAIVLLRRREIDLVVLDLSLLDTTEREMAIHLESDWADLPVVIISATEDWSLVARFVKAGILGFVPKSYNVEVMKNALGIIFAGGCYFPSQISLALSNVSLEASLCDADAEKSGTNLRPVRLYPRQEEILYLMHKGHSNKEIARAIGLSVGTVKNHVAAILHAFNVNSRSKAVKAAIDGGYIHPAPSEEG